MNITRFCLNNRVTTLFLTVVAIIAGLQAYSNMGRLEDPEFTIKDALVMTQYPGATAEEVEQEVTDRIEIAIQELGQIKELHSKSTRGSSIITVRAHQKYGQDELPQVWDELRRKVNDVQSSLPAGAASWSSPSRAVRGGCRPRDPRPTTHNST